MFDDLNPQVIIVLIVMVIGGVRWVIEQVKNSNRNPEDEQTSEFEDLYEEARLEILQRQGQIPPPPEQARPPHLETATVIRPGSVPPPRPPSNPPPIPMGAATPSARREVPRATTSQQPKKRVLTATEKEAIANFEALAKKSGKPRKSRSAVSVHVRQLLSNPTSAQDAIVLADILGPPKGSL